jgi:glycosyl hydrolase family 16
MSSTAPALGSRRSPLARGGRVAAVVTLIAGLAILAFVAVRATAGSSGGLRLPARVPAPPIVLPQSFQPIARYRELVKDYVFTGSRLPAGWSASPSGNHGFGATWFEPSRVRMTGSAVALSATRPAGAGDPYQSGWVSTEGGFSMTYGMVDFRAKMPAGQGLWSGLWLDQPDHSNPLGEIDVQEMLLGDTHTVYGSLHNWAPAPDWSELQTTVMADDASAGFHDYQVIWQRGLITWAIDGVAYAQYTAAQAAAAGQPWPFDDGTGYFLIADLAVAADWEWGGPPNSSTVFPATMLLRSVKVWE